MSADFDNFIDPAFEVYNKALARVLTDWLYRDPKSNPAFGNPELWGNFKVTIVSRTLNFTSLAASGGTSTQKLSLAGGKNVVVMNSRATVKNTTAPDFDLANVEKSLPNFNGSYITVEQKRTDGFLEIQTAPINNVFGTVPGWPDRTPAPMRWLGNSDRVFTITNNFGSISDVNLSWQIAMLDTAR
ncbi:MAG: hypothetical protein HN804_10960 [Oceanospirillaceae bacterium]|jgi:hypothetical protein|nr:hypothetical protein [Oceanospirillaceae bacterium]